MAAAAPKPQGYSDCRDAWAQTLESRAEQLRLLPVMTLLSGQTVDVPLGLPLLVPVPIEFWLHNVTVHTGMKTMFLLRAL